MIINGNPAGSVGFWSKHLLRDDTNEKAEVTEISGLSATTLRGALKEMQGVASGSRSQGNFMYQANINPQADEHLTPEQWKEAVDTLERNLGLEGHQRVVVEHIKEGRQHYHVIWNRVDVETMKVADMGGNWIIHEKTSRELETRFELKPTMTQEPGERAPQEKLWEKRAAERSGIDPKAMREELTELWRATDCGAAFKAAIEERGYVLAKGDRRDFCVVDRAGDAHSLARRLDGVKAADVCERMSDIDRDALPSVEEAREQQRSTPPRSAEPEIHYDQNEARRQSQIEREQMRIDRTGTSRDGTFQDAEKETFEPNASRTFEPDSGAAFGDAASNASEASLDAASKLFEGASKIADMAADLLAGTAPPKRDLHEDQVERLIEQRRAQAAFENIRDRMENGKALRPEDLLGLTRENLMNISARGDDYLREVIRRMEEDRERENDRGRERER